jgi:nucleotide-binding universal stress UspA family protein
MRLQLRQICVPTDLSEGADHAVHYAAALAHQHDAKLTLLHVLEDVGALVQHPDFSATGEVARAYFRKLEDAGADVLTEADLKKRFVALFSDDQAEVEGAAASEAPRPAALDQDQSVHRFLKGLEEGAAGSLATVGEDWWQDITVDRVVRYGHPVEEICHYAGKHATDLIVMGTHGRSGLGRVLLGSVAERVLRISPCPVLVVRHPDHDFTLVE